MNALINAAYTYAGLTTRNRNGMLWQKYFRVVKFPQYLVCEGCRELA